MRFNGLKDRRGLNLKIGKADKQLAGKALTYKLRPHGNNRICHI